MTRGSDSLCGAKTAGFSIEVQTPLPRERSCPLVKGWGAGCFTTRLLSLHYHLMHIMVQSALETECRFGGRHALASVPHHNQVFQLDLGL